jgi:beta-lactamase regulating signal transducer with metallopeptidase domain
VSEFLQPIILNTAIKSVVIISLLLVSIKLFRSFHSQTQYTVWRIVIAIMIIIPISSVFSVVPIFIPSTESAVINMQKTYYDPSSIQSATTQETPITDQTAIQPVDQSPSIWNIIFAIWMIGFIIGVLRIGYEIFYLRRFRKGSHNHELSANLNRLKRSLNIKKRISLVTTTHTDVPFTFGFFKPIIVIPKWILSETEDQQNNILLHELIHIKRADYLTNIILQFAHAIHWFNPLIWRISSEVRLSCEISCDTLVLSKGTNSINYAKQLLHVANLVHYHGQPAVSIPMVKPSEMKTRMAHILSTSHPNQSSKWKVLAIFLMISPLWAIHISSIPTFETLIDWSDGSTEEKRAAASHLGNYSSSQSLSILAQLMNDSDKQTAIHSLNSMTRIGKTDVFYHVEAKLNTSRDIDIIHASLKTMKSIGCVPAFSILSRYSLSENEVTQSVAKSAIQSYDRSKLLNWFKTEMQYVQNHQWMMRYLSDIENAGTVDIFMLHIANNNVKKANEYKSVYYQAIQNQDIRHFAKYVLEHEEK